MKTRILIRSHFVKATPKEKIRRALYILLMGLISPIAPVYKKNGCFYWSNHEDLSDDIPVIAKAEAIDWLESKGIIIELSVTHDLCHWVFSIYMKGGEEILHDTDFDFESFQTRLEAEEAAIIKALEML